MKIMMLASGSRSQYHVLRCAAALGHRVHVAGEGSAKLMAASFYCKECHDASFSPDQYETTMRRLNELCAAIGVDWVIASDARSTRFLATVKESIGAAVFPVPAPGVFDTLNDKGRFMGLCAQLGVPHPNSRVVAHKHELAEVLRRGEVRTPAIVKPLNRSAAVGFFKFDENELARVEEKIDYEPVVLQEFVEGDDVSISLFCREGEAAAAVAYRRSAGFCHFFQHDRFLEHALAITRHTRFDGVVNFDAKQAADGSVTLLECNPRFFFPVHTTMIAGINFVALGLERSTTGGRDGRLGMTADVRWTSRLIKDLIRPWRIETRDVSMLWHELRDPFVPVLIRLFTDVGESY